MTLYVHEGDRIGLPRQYSEQLLDADDNMPTLVADASENHADETDNGDTENGGTVQGTHRHSTLFTRSRHSSAPTPVSTPPAEEGRLRAEVLASWELIRKAAVDRLLLDPNLLLAVLGHAPELEPFVYHMFTRELKTVLRTRRKHFIDVREEVTSIKGRVDVRSLADRRARARLPVLCEFDDLTHDTAEWRIIRCANRIVGSGAHAAAADAARLDGRLTDVAIVGPHTAMRLLSTAPTNRRNRPLRTLLVLATAIIRHRYAVGVTADQHEAQSLIVKMPTSRIWEMLIADALRTSACWHVQSEAANQVGKGHRLFMDGQSKKPDLIVEVGGGSGKRVIIDAKYKLPIEDASGMGQLGMSDQYQCFAYATQYAAPTAFVTLSTSDESRLLCDTTTDPADSGVSAQPVALISLPFPRPDQGASIANPTELLRWVTKHAHSLR
ncbi:5-methylcytosine restriction system specificity protein McrC [Gordonia paraffinivorans]|uniref:5-methylcytosine restriction system specificity protein McrC n=3 Tax=Gordonia paraffinivorans TaxID=175628 RepID=UPI001446F392|nr:hypothetical protein [Gordonia paraffinivorans]